MNLKNSTNFSCKFKMLIINKTAQKFLVHIVSLLFHFLIFDSKNATRHNFDLEIYWKFIYQFSQQKASSGIKVPLRYATNCNCNILFHTVFPMPVHFKQSQTMKAQATVLTNLFLYAEQTISGNGYRYISWNIFIISGEGLWRNKKMPQTYLLPACFCGCEFCEFNWLYRSFAAVVFVSLILFIYLMSDY